MSLKEKETITKSKTMLMNRQALVKKFTFKPSPQKKTRNLNRTISNFKAPADTLDNNTISITINTGNNLMGMRNKIKGGKQTADVRQSVQQLKEAKKKKKESEFKDSSEEEEDELRKCCNEPKIVDHHRELKCNVVWPKKRRQSLVLKRDAEGVIIPTEAMRN